jgi:hypothetical protein
LLVAGSPAGSVEGIVGGADQDGSDRRRRRVNRRQVLVGAGTLLHCDVDAFGRKIGGDALAVWQECAAVAGRHQRRLRDRVSQDGRMQDLRIIDGGQSQQANASSRCSDHATLHALDFGSIWSAPCMPLSAKDDHWRRGWRIGLAASNSFGSASGTAMYNKVHDASAMRGKRPDPASAVAAGDGQPKRRWPGSCFDRALLT